MRVRVSEREREKEKESEIKRAERSEFSVTSFKRSSRKNILLNGKNQYAL